MRSIASSGRRFGAMGWLSIMVPEAEGGIGQSVIEAALVAEEMGRGQVLEPYAACGILPLRLLTALAVPRGGELVSAVAAGEAIVAVAHGEPQARGNVCDVSVSARRTGRDGKSAAANRSSSALRPRIGSSSRREQVASVPARETCRCSWSRPRQGRAVVGDRLMDWTSAADVMFDDVQVGPDALLGHSARVRVCFKTRSTKRLSCFAPRLSGRWRAPSM